jgi:hypothetical protein
MTLRLRRSRSRGRRLRSTLRGNPPANRFAHGIDVFFHPQDVAHVETLE